MTKLALVLLVGCGTTATQVDDLRTEAATIDRLHFSTATSIPQNQPPAVDVTVTGAAARAVYEATLDLQVMPPGGYNCPADFGVTYALDFYAGPDRVVSGVASPNGCNTATLTSATASVVFSIDVGYWTTLATNLGIAETQIYPYSVP